MHDCVCELAEHILITVTPPRESPWSPLSTRALERTPATAAAATVTRILPHTPDGGGEPESPAAAVPPPEGPGSHRMRNHEG